MNTKRIINKESLLAHFAKKIFISNAQRYEFCRRNMSRNYNKKFDAKKKHNERKSKQKRHFFNCAMIRLDIFLCRSRWVCVLILYKFRCHVFVKVHLSTDSYYIRRWKSEWKNFFFLSFYCFCFSRCIHLFLLALLMCACVHKYIFGPHFHNKSNFVKHL